jgi:crotonobetainyl-CoA:carnitine CoA-transferase CaiB-like acyl-CoA transferase
VTATEKASREGAAASRPLDGILVLDFSQFLAGPVAAMRLADLGATVIKIERPVGGDIGRNLAFAGMWRDDDSLSFHIMNRNKLGFGADLKDPEDLDEIRRLVARASVIIQNFRPGVMERIGLDYESVRQLNPQIVYGSVTGYGAEGPWRDRPGQDLLAQAMSGLPWLNGHKDQGPVPVGLSIADLLASCHLAQGITALLVRRERTGVGGLVETSLMEAMLDMQFELISAHLNDSTVEVRRGGEYGAHPFLPAPYGIYPSADGYLAVAMNPVPELGKVLGLDLDVFTDPETWWTERDEIERLLAGHLATETNEHWLGMLDAADIWAAPVLRLPELVQHPGYEALRMTQTIRRRSEDGAEVALQTTRSPLRVDGETLTSEVGAPRLGEHNEEVRRRYLDGQSNGLGVVGGAELAGTDLGRKAQ